MKRLMVFAISLICGIVPQLNAQAQCDDRTMTGTYVMSASGTLDGLPIAVIAKIFYDGQGKGTATETVSVGGQIFADIPATGVFTANSDCTGSKTFTSSLGVTHYNFVITPDGSKITWIETDTGATLNGTAVRFRDEQRVHE